MGVEETAQQIEDLEIQGATNIAIEAVKAVKEVAEDGGSQDEIAEAVDRLVDTRPTEPALRNALASVLEQQNFDEVLVHLKDARHAIANEAADMIDDDDIVYTHCHSSTVGAVLRHAHSQTDFTVRNTETRPVYQGRTTAEELAHHGIDVEHYVDAAAKIALENADLMLIGADAITWQGDIYNKVGSGMIAETAHDLGVPVYVCTDSWKLDPRTRDGHEVQVEERGPEEVWEDPPDDVAVRNPAFEIVIHDHIDAIITELGTIPPDRIGDELRSAYPALLE